MLVKVVLAYLVIACAAFVWLAKTIRYVPGESPQADAAARMMPKSFVLMIACLCLLGAAFWPATLVTLKVMSLLLKRAGKEIDDDDDDDGMPQEA